MYAAAEAVVPISRKYSNEAAMLKNLLSPPPSSKTTDVESESKSYPDSNPFKTMVVQISRKHCNEAAALNKLLVRSTPIKITAIQSEKKCYPDNNPFKTTKGTVYDNKIQNAEQNATMESSQCKEGVVITRSQMEMNQEKEKEGQATKPCGKIYHLKRKVEVVDYDFDVCSSERVSVLTNVDSSNNVICTTPASQTSVNSKPNKKLRAGIGNKSILQNQAKSSEIGKNLILRFFQDDMAVTYFNYCMPLDSREY